MLFVDYISWNIRTMDRLLPTDHRYLEAPNVVCFFLLSLQQLKCVDWLSHEEWVQIAYSI